MKSTKVDTAIGIVRCGECRRAVDEFTAIAEKWGYWSDGIVELPPFCTERVKALVRARRFRERAPRERAPSLDH